MAVIPSHKDFLDIFNRISPSKHRYTVFTDFVTMFAISLHNAIVKNEKWEEEYLRCIVSVQRTHLPLKMNFAHDTVFTGAYHDHHTYPRHMATTPSRMAAKPTQQKRLLPKTQSQTYHVLQMGKQTLRQNNTHLT